MAVSHYEGVVFETIGYRTLLHSVLINEASLSMPELIDVRDGFLYPKQSAIALELMDFIRLVSRTTAITFDNALEPDVEAFKVWWQNTTQSPDLRAKFYGYMQVLTDDLKAAWLKAVEAAEAENRRPVAPDGLQGDGSAPDATPLADDISKAPGKSSARKSHAK